MSDAATLRAGELLSTTAVKARLSKRYARERRFRFFCGSALWLAIGFLALLFGNILLRGAGAFTQIEVRLDIFLDPEVIDPQGTRDPDVLTTANYAALVRDSLVAEFPDDEFDHNCVVKKAQARNRIRNQVLGFCEVGECVQHPLRFLMR